MIKRSGFCELSTEKNTRDAEKCHTCSILSLKILIKQFHLRLLDTRFVIANETRITISYLTLAHGIIVNIATGAAHSFFRLKLNLCLLIVMSCVLECP